jgi:ribosome-associated protein
MAEAPLGTAAAGTSAVDPVHIQPVANPADPETEAMARLAAEACDDRKAVDIRLIRVDEVSSLADWFVICSGLSDVQVRAIARSVEDRLEQDLGRLPLRREGQSAGSWLLLDYGEVIVHVLTPSERDYYDLESFWGHGEQVRYLSSSSASNA